MKKYRVEFNFTDGKSYTNHFEVDNFDELNIELSKLMTSNNISYIPASKVTNILVMEVKE